MPRTKGFNEQETIKKAQNLFHKKGFASTSMQDLVDELQLSRSSIYETFINKENLYCKALLNYTQENGANFVREAEKTENPEELITAIFTDLIHTATIEDEKSCFVVNATLELRNTHEEVDRIITENNTSFLEGLVVVLDKIKEKNSTLSFDSFPTALFLFNNIIGIRVMLKNNLPQEQIKSLANQALQNIGIRIE
jgi:TetR/AcrR family transcriptional regulator, transcriptional repressor for nem operon